MITRDNIMRYLPIGALEHFLWIFHLSWECQVIPSDELIWQVNCPSQGSLTWAAKGSPAMVDLSKIEQAYRDIH